MFSSSRLRTAGVVVATATLLTASAQGEFSGACYPSCKIAADYGDISRRPCLVCDDDCELQIEDGYGRCRCYPKHCVTLDEDGQCVCETGYYNEPRDYYMCYPCANTNCNCQASDPRKCTGCATGLGLNEYKTDCKPCTAPHCTACDANYAECTSCEDRYGLDSNHNCVKCGDEHCLQCSGTNPSVCTTCEEGRYWDTDTKACELCRNNEGCAKCTKKADGTTTCTACRVGFELNGPPECIKCPMDKCASCSTDGQSCYACYDGDNIYPTFESRANRCDRKPMYCWSSSHRVTGTTVLLGIAAAAAALLF